MALRGQRAMDEKEGHLLEDTVLREVLDRIAAVIEAHASLAHGAYLREGG